MADNPLPRDNILPDNATRRERAISDVDARLGDIDLEFIRRVRDPAQTPLDMLAYLAWERSVDVWDPAWPEDVKRAVVAVSPIVHRYKGTRYAVETALDALGVATQIVEWWQSAPQGAPYTFKVTAYARSNIYNGDFILDPRLIKVVFDTIMRTKPLSRAFDLAVGAGFASPLQLAGIGVAKTKHRAAPSAGNALSWRQPLGLAAIAVARSRHRATITLSAAL